MSRTDDDEDRGTANGTGVAFGDPRAVVSRWEVPPDHDGDRADVVLVGKVRRLSRARAQRIIAAGDFRGPGGALKASARLPVGTTVELWRIPPDEKDARTDPALLHEDDDLVVVDKPGDLVVHPSARYLHATLTSWLKEHAADVGGRVANPCHRLDRETSGVLVCAKSAAAERALKIAFAEGRVEKRYLAIVRGVVDAPFTVDAPLALQGERGLVRIRMVVDDAGLPSRTDVEPLRCAGGRTLVAATPRTGRQHQIRAHLAHAGFPIVGDKLYAMGDAWFDAFTRRALSDDERAALDHPRQALHAERCAFALHGVRREFVAPLPADLAALI